MKVVNPATGELLRDVPEHSEVEVSLRLAQAERAFAAWREVSFAERAAGLRRAAEVLRDRSDRYAALITEEMGKPIAGAAAEVEKCAKACDFYAEHGERFLAPEPVASDAAESFVRYDPLGPVLAVMPWNFPFWQLFRFAAPALMAGNVGLLKHAANVPGCALAIEEVFRDAGFPDGAMTALLLSAEDALALIRRPEIRAVTLTGSERAGREIAAEAGRQLKKTVLELGGSDPFLVLADADPVAVAREAAQARIVNSGQSCIAAKRFLVAAPIADAFEREFTRAMEALRVGDPTDPKTEVGPMAREDLLDSLDRQVRRSLEEGARRLCGGHRLDRPGFYYAPTVLSEVRPGMTAFEEETFGPVAAVVRVQGDDEAVEIANRSSFGLGASVWTSDPARGAALAPRIEAGAVFVNGAVKSDPRLPFGGIKNSGYGRELSVAGIREFVNIKAVWVR